MEFSPGERAAILSGFPDEDEEEAPAPEASSPEAKLPPALTPEVLPPRPAAPAVPENPLLAGEKIVRGRLPALEAVHGRFGNLFKQTLSRALGRAAEIEVRGTRVTSFGAYVRMLPNPSSIYLYKMAPLKGLAAFVPSQRLIFTLVEALLGGGGGLNKSISNRELTKIEHRMMDPLISEALADLAKAWQSIFKVAIRFSHLEVNPAHTTLALPEDPVVVSLFETVIGEESHAFSLCEPLAVLAPIRKRLERMAPGL